MRVILDGDSYLALPREPETFIIEPLLPLGGAMALYGDPKVGKSYAAIQLALSIADPSEMEWLGFPVATHGKVVYIQLDTPRSLWADRLDQLRSGGKKIELIDFGDRETLNTWPFDILNAEHFNLLKSSLVALKPLLVIVDTLKESHQLDENDATESQKVIAGLTAATQPAALVLIHHGRKPTPDRPDTVVSGARGSSYLIGKMDSIVHMSKRSIQYTGRAIEEGSFRCERLDNGFWAPATAEIDQLIEQVLAQTGTTRQAAKLLAEKTGRSDEACRSMIRRYTTLVRSQGGSRM